MTGQIATGNHVSVASGGYTLYAERERYVLALQVSLEGRCIADDVMLEGGLADMAWQVDALRARFHAAGAWQRAVQGEDTHVAIVVCVLAMGVLSLDGGPEEMGDRDPRVCLMREVAGGVAGDIQARLEMLGAA